MLLSRLVKIGSTIISGLFNVNMQMGVCWHVQCAYSGNVSILINWHILCPFQLSTLFTLCLSHIHVLTRTGHASTNTTTVKGDKRTCNTQEHPHGNFKFKW